MGAVISVELWSESRAEGESAIAAVTAEMHRIDRAMSPHKPDSELSRINRDAGAAPVPLSAEMARLLARADEFSRLTGGAFGISYAAVGQLYDYRERVRPTDAVLVQARAAVGYRHLHLDARARTPRFGLPGMRIDLGGFAKGHAVDNAAAILRERGVQHAMVSAGGDSRVIGDHRCRLLDRRHPRPAPAWRDGGLAAAGQRADLELGRLRALLPCRRPALPSPERPRDGPLAARRPQRDHPRRRRARDRGLVEGGVRAGHRDPGRRPQGRDTGRRARRRVRPERAAAGGTGTAVEPARWCARKTRPRRSA